MIAHEGVGVAVVHVARIAPEHGPDAALLIGPVDRVEVLRGRVGPLAAQERGGGQELRVGDRDGPVDRGHDDVDIRVVGGPVVGRDGQHRLVALAVPVTGQGVLEPGHGRIQPARDTDAHGVGHDRLEALQLRGTGEERGAVLLLPQVVGLGPGRRSAGSSGWRRSAAWPPPAWARRAGRYICRMARVCKAGPSVWSVQLRGVPLIKNAPRSKSPPEFWQVCANCT